MAPRPRVAPFIALIIILINVRYVLAAEQPRYGGVLTWLEYADPGRLDIHSESPLSVLQAVAGIYSGLLQYGPDDPDQWGPDLAERWETSADGLLYSFLVERATQVAAAKAGQILLWNVGPPMRKGEAEEVKQARGDQAEVYLWPTGSINVAYMHQQKAPFDNPAIRRAMHLAIDRQEIFQRAFEGDGTPSVILDPQLYPEYALPMEEVQHGLGCRQPKEQDIAEAKRLIEQHAPGGFDLDVVVRALGPTYTDPAQLIIQQLRRIGIRGTLRTMESAAGFTAYARGDFHFIGSQGTLINSPDVHDPFSFVFHSNGSRNYSGFHDAKIDDLIERGLRESDPAKRKETYWELQRYILTQPLPQLTLGWPSGWFYADKRVRNFKPGKLIYEGLTHTTLWLSAK